MKKTLTAIAVIAAFGLAMPTATWAQEVIGQNGQAVDGQGAGGQQQNKFVPDGFPNTGAITPFIPKTSARINDACNVAAYLQPAYCADFNKAPPRLLRNSSVTSETSSDNSVTLDTSPATSPGY
jgi:opacity protein-like surface antigen